MSQKTQFDADVAAVETELPARFRVGRKEWTGSRVAIPERAIMEDAGAEISFSFMLVVRVAAFLPGKPLPVEKNIEVLDDATGQWLPCFIKSATPAQDGVTIEYGIVDNS